MNPISTNGLTARHRACNPFWNKLFLVYSILHTGGSIAFFHSIEGTAFLFLAALLLAVLNFLNISMNLLISLGIWFFYFIGSSIAIGSFHPYFMVEIPVAIFCAYVIIRTLGKKSIGIFIQTIYLLAALSIPLYLLQVCLPQVMLPVLHYFNIQGDLFTLLSDCGSIVLYSYNISANSQMRNCGFCWEPGAFACLCIFALFLNYFFEAKKSKKVNLVLLIGLLTTFSTTGYSIAFLLVCSSLLWNKKMRTKMFLIPVVLLFFYVMLNCDFLWEKISEQLSKMTDFETNIGKSIDYNKHYTLGRFPSFWLAWKNLELRPIFGYAGNAELEYSVQRGASVAIISGWGLLISRYGLFGLFLFLYLLCRSGFYWDKFKIKEKENFFIPWLILQAGIAVSYKFFLTPVCFFFFFFPLFAQSDGDSSCTGNSADGDEQ